MKPHSLSPMGKLLFDTIETMKRQHVQQTAEMQAQIADLEAKVAGLTAGQVPADQFIEGLSQLLGGSLPPNNFGPSPQS
ncbi:hypothetical protein ACEN2J_19540 [Pseudorhodobacter sp. W20_MBD10_FR17]|uniref:hypothetical protein n=1 Tax=Pseudorhodobacter sp. W20_MBD10_FR17 TaxID=3240266 RepID=UPI003F95FB66